MNKLPERIRIKDIARLADVSVGTVDRVIHGRSGMRSEGKKRTLELSLIQGFSKIEKFFGGATRNRTGDTRIFSPLLYQLSYGTVVLFNECKGKHYLLHSKCFNGKYSKKMYFKEDTEKSIFFFEKKQQNYLQFKN